MKHMASGHTMTWVKGEGYVYSHVLALQKKLGRKLKNDELAHHIDGNKENNAPSNLMLVLRGQSRGGIPSHASVDGNLKHGGRPAGS